MGSETGSVCVGGMPFGVKFYTEGILVVGFCDVDVNSAGGGCRNVNPARDAGLKIKDVIVGVNGEKPLCSATLTKAVEESGGSPITLTVKYINEKKSDCSVTLSSYIRLLMCLSLRLCRGLRQASRLQLGVSLA